MNEEKLEELIIKVEQPLADETLEDGLTVLASALVSVVIGAVEQGAFDRAKIHDFFSGLESEVKSKVGMGIRRR